MKKQMKSASKISTQHSSSWGRKNEDVKMEVLGKKSKLDTKIQDLKNASEKLSRKTVNGRSYKNQLISWFRATQVSGKVFVPFFYFFAFANTLFM